MFAFVHVEYKMSENNDISPSKSTLPWYMIDILNKGMSEGFEGDALGLRSK